MKSGAVKQKHKIKKRKIPKKPSFLWAGALAELGRKYTSVELQHKISRGRGRKTPRQKS